jgi:tRNA-dihydrouridine synthase A
VDGVMLGRAAYHNPYLLAEAEAYAFGEPAHRRTRAEIVQALLPYVEAQLSQGVGLRAIARHVLGLYHGASGARAWRRMLSDSTRLEGAGPELFLGALSEVEPQVVADVV